MNVDSILISDYATIAAGKLTVVGCFNSISGATLPVMPAIIALSVVVHAHPSEAGSSHTMEVKLLNARREEIKQLPPASFKLPNSGVVTTPGVPLRHVAVFNLLRPKFEAFGPYAFEIYIDGTYAAGVSFFVGESPPQQRPG